MSAWIAKRFHGDRGKAVAALRRASRRRRWRVGATSALARCRARRIPVVLPATGRIPDLAAWPARTRPAQLRSHAPRAATSSATTTCCGGTRASRQRCGTLATRDSMMRRRMRIGDPRRLAQPVTIPATSPLAMTRRLFPGQCNGPQEIAEESRQTCRARPRVENPCGQSASTTRRCANWPCGCPPGYDDGTARGKSSGRGRRYPVLWDLVGFTGSGMAHVGWRPFDENVPERAARLIHERKMGPCIIVFPDCFNCLGGNQYINSSAMGNYADYLTQRTDSIRRPRIPHAGLARPPRLLRQVIGWLRRDDPRHEVREILGRDRRSFRRRLFRLLLPHRLAAHAERTRPLSPSSPAARQDRRDQRCRRHRRQATTTAA